VYSISAYGAMIADSVRMEAYARALRQVIKPTSVVLDIGSGTGIFSLLACRYGARRVYAIEPDDAIMVAQASARANGCADRIQFIQDLSTRVTLPEQVDVLVSDIRGVLPLFGSHLPSIIDARQRFLLPGGFQIPLRDRILAAPVETAKDYRNLVQGHYPNPYDVNLEAALQFTSNSQFKVTLTSEQLLADPQAWMTLDYASVQSSNFSSTMTWTVARSGACHGIAVWFDTFLAENCFFSNAPSLPNTLYGQSLFPWPLPVELATGDIVDVTLKADPIDKDYNWRWDSRVVDPKRPDQAKAQFTQSTFFGIPRVPARLRKRSPAYVPNLDEEGQVEQFILNSMDGLATVQSISDQVRQRYPEKFQREQDAMDRVAAVSLKYSR
jgi:SAM-dependent methyltransferase